MRYHKIAWNGFLYLLRNKIHEFSFLLVFDTNENKIMYIVNSDQKEPVGQAKQMCNKLPSPRISFGWKSPISAAVN